MNKNVIPFKRAQSKSLDADAIESDLALIEQDLDNMVAMLSFTANLLSNSVKSNLPPKQLKDLETQMQAGYPILEDYEQALAQLNNRKLSDHIANSKIYSEKMISVARRFLDLQQDLLKQIHTPRTKPKKPKRKSTSQFQLKVSLKDSHPPIWRRILVPGEYSLGELHETIQKAMGWSNSHLHHFQIGRKFYGVPAPHDLIEILNESQYRLCDLQLKEGSRLRYEYDFGDSWIHTIQIEKITSAQIKTACCIDGKRACPPEDSGGIRHYHSLLFILRNPHHPRHQEITEWLGEDFDPEYFSLN